MFQYIGPYHGQQRDIQMVKLHLYVWLNSPEGTEVALGCTNVVILLC